MPCAAIVAVSWPVEPTSMRLRAYVSVSPFFFCAATLRACRSSGDHVTSLEAGAATAFASGRQSFSGTAAARAALNASARSIVAVADAMGAGPATR